MFKTSSSTEFARRCLALTAVLGASVTMMGAQSLSQASTPSPVAVQAVSPMQSVSSPQAVSLPLAVSFPQAPSSSSSSSDLLFSSSSAENAAANSDAGTQNVASLSPLSPNFGQFMQYGGGRRRYGSPRYRGGNTNADGSAKYMFFGGAGFTQPIGNTWKYFTPNWGIQVGGGRQFSRHFAVPVEFDWDHMGLTEQAISNEAYIYTGDSNAADNGIDANAHVWSLSVDPRYTLFGSSGDGFGMYALADVGFYHKVTNLTAPTDEEYCSYYGCGTYEVNANFDHYTSNAPGFGLGVGFTYKFSHFSNEKFYAEGRYVFIDNSQRTGYTAAESAAGVVYTGSDFFPANSNRTTYFPVKFGLQF